MNYSRLLSAILLAVLLTIVSAPSIFPVHAAPTTITITSNADFATCFCVSGGTGAASDPYILSGLTLISKTAPGILVDNTAGTITKFFNIVGDTITGGSGSPTDYPGIEFVKVDGLGKVTGSKNTFNGNHYGILLVDSSHILIDGKSTSNGATVNSNGVTGIAIVRGGFNTIRNIQVEHNGVGISEGFFGGGVGITLNATTGNLVWNVVLSEDSFAGLAMFGATNSLVDGISVHYPDFYGAVIDGGSGNTIQNSVLQTADFVGLWLREHTSGNEILNNNIYANGPIGNEIKPGIVPYFTVGLYISSGAHDNVIRNNNFNNGNTGGSIIQDNGQIVNAVQSPIQSNNPFNDPATGNEPANPVRPSGPAGAGNIFCGNAITTTQGVPSNPPCT
jgi:hypothetical protein